jgi:DnaK suppressor protein
MARREALLRLYKNLMSRRADLRKRLAGDLADLRNVKAATSDSVDVAFDTGSEEIATQIAELDARELNQIERALARMKQGSYGVCELCQKKIPVARLNALPYSTTCIECKREMELSPGWESGRGSGDWEKVYEAGTPMEEEREINLSEIEMDLSNH